MVKFFIAKSKIKNTPSNNSKLINPRAIIGAENQLAMPRSIKFNSNGSIGNNFNNPEAIKINPNKMRTECAKNSLSRCIKQKGLPN